MTTRPARLRETLRESFGKSKRQHDKDLARGAGSVWILDALSASIWAPWERAWQWGFSDAHVSRPRDRR